MIEKVVDLFIEIAIKEDACNICDIDYLGCKRNGAYLAIAGYVPFDFYLRLFYLRLRFFSNA